MQRIHFDKNNIRVMGKGRVGGSQLPTLPTFCCLRAKQSLRCGPTSREHRAVLLQPSQQHSRTKLHALKQPRLQWQRITLANQTAAGGHKCSLSQEQQLSRGVDNRGAEAQQRLCGSCCHTQGCAPMGRGCGSVSAHTSA